MIYNMLTISAQLLLIGFFVGVIAYFLFPKGRSQVFVIELGLSILGAFLGTLFEVMIRSLWDLPLIYHMLSQFLVPLATAIAAVVLYRLANSIRD
jgi:uncharacterized membrane protein YeaQ/YmgE (transglycosylase-associated protein family)